MTYRFMGVYREQLWFATPNIAACFLVMVIVLCIGVFLSLVNHKNIYSKIIAIMPASIAVFAQLLLVYSYSRGGYVALVVGLLLLIWLSRSKWMILFSAFFTLFLFVVKNGLTRVGTIGEFADGSIRNRFLLWEGAMALISENFHKGVQTTTNMGKEYTTWFQPLWLDEHYRLMINDFLTATCAWGIWVSGGILLLIAIVFLLGWQTQRRSKSPLLAGILSCIIVFLACGVFSTMSFDLYTLKYIFASALLLTLIWSIVFAIRNKYWQWRNLWIPAIAVGGACFIFIIACHIVRSGYPYHYEKIQVNNSLVTVVTPDDIQNTLVLTVNENDDFVKVIRDKVRPLVDLGYKVYFTQVDSGINGLQNAKDFLQFAISDSNNTSPILLMENLAGKQLFIAVAESSTINNAKIIINNIPETWPFDELSPINFAHKIDGEVVFVKKSSKKLGALQEKMQACNIGVTEFVVEDEKVYAESLNEIINNSIFSKEKLNVIIFERSGCESCKKLEEKINQLPQAIKNKIAIERINLDEPNKKTELAGFFKAYNHQYRAAMPTPIVFFSETTLYGEDTVKLFGDKLSAILSSEETPAPTKYPTNEQLQSAELGIVRSFQTIPVIAIFIAGLIDGVNPCIFTGLIFFISLLTMAKFKRATLVKVGVVYATACYITYFLMGSGLLGALSFVANFHGVLIILYSAMALLLIILSIFSFCDAIKYKRSAKADSVMLQLPNKIKLRIKNTMKSGINKRTLLVSVFGTGVLVTLLESACTAQLYLPTMTVLFRHGGLTLYTFSLLALYNLACIVPLLAVFGATLYGVNMIKLSQFSKKQIFWSKLGIGILFLFLATLLLFLL